MLYCLLTHRNFDTLSKTCGVNVLDCAGRLASILLTRASILSSCKIDHGGSFSKYNKFGGAPLVIDQPDRVFNYPIRHHFDLGKLERLIELIKSTGSIIGPIS